MAPARSSVQPESGYDGLPTTGLRRVFRAVRHVHQNRQIFQCALVIEKLSLRVPSPKRVNVTWIRGVFVFRK